MTALAPTGPSRGDLVGAVSAQLRRPGSGSATSTKTSIRDVAQTSQMRKYRPLAVRLPLAPRPAPCGGSRGRGSRAWRGRSARAAGASPLRTDPRPTDPRAGDTPVQVDQHRHTIPPAIHSTRRNSSRGFRKDSRRRSNRGREGPHNLRARRRALQRSRSEEPDCEMQFGVAK
jgi:hypothetical protein